MSATSNRIPDSAWLVLGILAAAVTGMRFNVPWVAWIQPVPWLIYLRRTRSLKSRLAFFGALQVGLFLQLVTIITEPLPWFFAPMFSVPMALSLGLALWLFEVWRRRIGDRWGVVLFVALTVVLEWVAGRYGAQGSWGSVAYTQIDNLALLQSTSLVGLSGIAALMASAAALATVAIDGERDRAWRVGVAATAGLLLVAQLWGAWRLTQPLDGPHVTVAGVVSDIGLGAGGMPSDAEMAAATDALFARSEAAMARGAELVVWNEGAIAVSRDEEASLQARGLALSATHGADLVLAYVVPLDGMASFENKYVWLTPTGPAETYLKHHPVPGEGSVKGTAPIVALDRPYGRVAGAICYDYDFPALGRAHAAQGAGLVVVPSSDWAGIDPLHTRMASVRGIEGGYSVLRPVRWATSGAFDAYGRPHATMSWFEDTDRVFVTRLPVTQHNTLYNRIGDVLPASSGLGLLALAGLGLRRRREG
ncbi:MAG: apolipoprotein N-acyltransferase [Myxococcota bacterium]|jgi:apolipoprotein N-acyltransferase